MWWSLVPRWKPGRVRTLGEEGEKLASRFLRRKGYRIVSRGERNRYGELDLVAIDGRTVVFVEVKTRRRADPEEAMGSVLTVEQQLRITRAAFSYRKRHRLLDCPARFDLVTILWPVAGRPVIRHCQNALETEGLDDAIY